MSETKAVYRTVSYPSITSGTYDRNPTRSGYEDEEADKPIVEADHVHICRICNAQWV